jgi:glycosyltransferase involved in cell wall biosynthesis
MTFLNFPHESFTPAQSGALATIIWECCRVAAAEGEMPNVVTIGIDAEPFPWPKTIFLPPPRHPASRIGHRLALLRQKLGGWRFAHQPRYWKLVSSAIRQNHLDTRPMVVMNDPEGAAFLSRAFPRTKILLWFQNHFAPALSVKHRLKEGKVSIVACSDFTARWVEKEYQLLPGAVATVYNGVDLREFHPAVDGRNRKRINFSGRMIEDKGPDLILRAALELRRKGHELEVQLLGWNHWDRFELDAYQRELQKLRDELQGMGVPVYMPGRIARSGMADELRKAAIHVVPSRWEEPFGITTIEGMACGLPTVGSATGGTPEIVRDCGMLFQSGDYIGLSRELESLLTDARLWSEYSSRARNRAEQFSWNRAWQSLRALCGNGELAEAGKA